MRKLVISLISMVFLVSGCNCWEEDYMNNISLSDQTALIEMNDAILASIYYHDSLVSYIREAGNSNDSMGLYYDYHYHFHDSLFNMHDNHYSHSNGWNDHHNKIGGMMGQGRNSVGTIGQSSYMNHMYNHNQQGMEHHIEDHYLMDSLLIAHQPYHPNN